MPPPLVSIIIPAFLRTPREAELLAETLRTVAAQTHQDFECLVVDDGSPLSVRDIADGFPRTTVIRQENAGSAMARNGGIRSARGSYFVFLDADDHLLPQALAAGLSALAEHPHC